MNLSVRPGYNCPHLNEQMLCTIYDSRPVECRIFPYTVNQTYQMGSVVLFTYHGKTPCSRKKELFPSHRETRRQILTEPVMLVRREALRRNAVAGRG